MQRLVRLPRYTSYGAFTIITHDKTLTILTSDDPPISSRLRYAYLAKFIVLSEEESDLRLLELAMDGIGTTEAALVEFLCARPPA